MADNRCCNKNMTNKITYSWDNNKFLSRHKGLYVLFKILDLKTEIHPVSVIFALILSFCLGVLIGAIYL